MSLQTLHGCGPCTVPTLPLGLLCRGGWGQPALICLYFGVSFPPLLSSTTGFIRTMTCSRIHYHAWQHDLTLSLLRVINVNFPLQPHHKYYITQYGELGFSWLSQMTDDYTTNSHSLTYTFSLPFHSQEWSISNFSCSLTRNITSHSMENLAFHSLLRWKMIILPILTPSLIHFSLGRLGECNFWTREWKG